MNITSAKIIAVIGEKGGIGKTQLSCILAAHAATNGKQTALIDLDPQVTATNWADRRVLDNPVVVSCQVARLEKVIETAVAGGAEYIVIDTAGKATDAAIAAARNADLVIIPCEPVLNCIETLPKIKNILSLARNPDHAVVINKAPTQGSRHHEAEHLIVEHYNLEVAPVVMFLRIAHSDSSNIGQTASEFEPDSKAAMEAIELYKYTNIRLYGEGEENGSKSKRRA